MRLLSYSSVMLLLSIGSIARADIVFDTGNDPGGVENVLFNDSASGSDIIGPATTLRGHLAGTATATCASGKLCVDVVGQESLVVNNSGGGQATIEAAPGGGAASTGYTYADIFLTIPPGGVYTKIVFALSTDAQTTSDFTITVTEGNGQTNQASYTLDSGNNFFTVVAIAGQDIRNVNLTANTGEFDTLKQLRIGGFPTTNPPNAIPEPTSVVLLSSMVAGVALLRKRFKAVTV
jgi:hypothetical protein